MAGGHEGKQKSRDDGQSKGISNNEGDIMGAAAAVEGERLCGTVLADGEVGDNESDDEGGSGASGVVDGQGRIGTHQWWLGAAPVGTAASSSRRSRRRHP